MSSRHASEENCRKLEELRRKIRKIEGSATGEGRVAVLGIPALDRVLPGGGLPLHCLHEIGGSEQIRWNRKRQAREQRHGDHTPGHENANGCGTVFLLWLLLRLPDHPPAAGMSRQIVWITGRETAQRRGLPVHSSVMRAGLDPDDILFVLARDQAGSVAAFEEALRCRSVMAAVLEGSSLDLRQGRRVQLAAESGGSTAFLLNRPRAAQGEPSVAATRWAVRPEPRAGGEHGRFRLALLRARGTAGGWQTETEQNRDQAGPQTGLHGRQGRWIMEWTDATGDLSLAAFPCD